MMTIYSPCRDAEMWPDMSLDEAAADAADSYKSAIRLPWVSIWHNRRQWEPSEGMQLTIAKGDSVNMTYAEIAPEIGELLIENAASEIGEASEHMELPDDLQDQFIAWLHTTCGRLNIWRIENVADVDVIFQNGEWHMKETSE